MTSLSSVFLILAVVLIISKCHGTPYKHRTKGVPLFIFGDSFVDVGNNNYINTTTLDQANFWPYGETYFRFPTGRFSDGRLLPDFIAEYAGLPLILPYLQPGNTNYYNGVNFASSGGGALDETFKGKVIPLKTQSRDFKKVVSWFRHMWGNHEAKMVFSTAVYLFSIGTNDYLSPLLTNSSLLSSYTQPQYIGMVIGNLTTVVKDIYKSGGRKFAFINLPPLGCLPAIRIRSKRNKSCFEEVSSWSSLHNEALSNLLQDLNKQLNGFKYTLYDFNTNLEQRINHPSRYGFKEGKTACCGTGQFRGVNSCGGRRPVKEFQLCEKPSEYVFWDSFHATEHLYKQLATEMWSYTTKSHAPGPYTLKHLFQ